MPPNQRTIVSLPGLIDLAIGSPEPGAVNFNVLHTLLHIIIRQICLTDIHVEFRGPQAQIIQAAMRCASPIPTVKLSQYSMKVTETGSLEEIIVEPAGVPVPRKPSFEYKSKELGPAVSKYQEPVPTELVTLKPGISELNHVESVPVKSRPEDLKFVQPKPTVPFSAEPRHVDSKPTELTPADIRPGVPTESMYVESKPTELRPEEVKPTKPYHAESYPAESYPADTSYIESRPTDVKPGVPKATGPVYPETRHTESKPTEPWPLELAPREQKLGDTHYAETRYMDPQTTEARPGIPGPTEPKVSEVSPAEAKYTEPKPTEPQPSVPRSADPRFKEQPPELRLEEVRSKETRPTKEIPAELKHEELKDEMHKHQEPKTKLMPDKPRVSVDVFKPTEQVQKDYAEDKELKYQEPELHKPSVELKSEEVKYKEHEYKEPQYKVQEKHTMHDKTMETKPRYEEPSYIRKSEELRDFDPKLEIPKHVLLEEEERKYVEPKGKEKHPDMAKHRKVSPEVPKHIYSRHEEQIYTTPEHFVDDEQKHETKYTKPKYEKHERIDKEHVELRQGEIRHREVRHEHSKEKVQKIPQPDVEESAMVRKEKVAKPELEKRRRKSVTSETSEVEVPYTEPHEVEVVLVESFDDTAKAVLETKRKIVTPDGGLCLEELSMLEDKVNTLIKNLAHLEEIPSSSELLRRTSAGVVTPIDDMWKIINLTKRMDAAEYSMQKITSVTDDLGRGINSTHRMIVETKRDIDELKGHIRNVDKRVWDIENRQSITERRLSNTQPVIHRSLEKIKTSPRTSIQELRRSIDKKRVSDGTTWGEEQWLKEERLRQAEEEKARAETARKLEDERLKAEEAFKRAEEERIMAEKELKEAEEEKKKALESKKKAEEYKQRLETEHKKADDEQRQNLEEELKRAEEEKTKADEELKKAENEKRKVEEQKKKAEEDLKKAEAEKKEAELAERDHHKRTERLKSDILEKFDMNEDYEALSEQMKIARRRYEGLSPEESASILHVGLETVKRDICKCEVHQIHSFMKNVPADKLIETMKRMDNLKQVISEVFGVKLDDETVMVSELTNMKDMEQKVEDLSDQVKWIDTTVNTTLEALHGQVDEMDRELGIILERMNAGMPIGTDGMAQDFAGLNELYIRFQQLQKEVTELADIGSKLMSDKEDKHIHMLALKEQVENLRLQKADKDELDEVLIDKANTQDLNRKVSHEQFEAVYDELTRNMEEALQKLTEQETLWSQTLDEVQREMENKLDKMEISPLKDFVNEKLKNVQKKLKALQDVRRDVEAAGTKRKLLRDVNCVSCDADAIMLREEHPLIPLPDPLPPTRSMKPYLAYELDHFRQSTTRQTLPWNLHNYESAIREQQARKRRPATAVDRKNRHLCNRYCGGSHTVTTPQQRVARMGHFKPLAGIEVAPLTETMIRGTDGRFYKGSNVAASTDNNKNNKNGLASLQPNSDLPRRRSSALTKDKHSNIEVTKTQRPVSASPAANSTIFQKKFSLTEEKKTVKNRSSSVTRKKK